MLTEKEATRLKNYTKYIGDIADDVHKRNVKIIKDAVDDGVFDQENYDKSIAVRDTTWSECNAILKRYMPPEATEMKENPDDKDEVS